MMYRPDHNACRWEGSVKRSTDTPEFSIFTFCLRDFRTTARFLGRVFSIVSPGAIPSMPTLAKTLRCPLELFFAVARRMPVSGNGCVSCQPRDSRARVHLAASLAARWSAVLKAWRDTTLDAKKEWMQWCGGDVIARTPECQRRGAAIQNPVVPTGVQRCTLNAMNRLSVTYSSVGNVLM